MISGWWHVLLWCHRARWMATAVWFRLTSWKKCLMMWRCIWQTPHPTTPRKSLLTVPLPTLLPPPQRPNGYIIIVAAVSARPCVSSILLPLSCCCFLRSVCVWCVCVHVQNRLPPAPPPQPLDKGWGLFESQRKKESLTWTADRLEPCMQRCLRRRPDSSTA